MARPTRLAALCAPIVLSLGWAGAPGLQALGADGLHPLEPSDTSSPRATLVSFIDSCNEFHALVEGAENADGLDAITLPARQRILDCLDLTELPRDLRESAGTESAMYLKEVLDRIELPPTGEIPDAEGITVAAGTTGPLRWRIPRTRIEIARVEEGPHQGEYLLTPETVRLASEFYECVKQLPYREQGPRVSEGLCEAYVSVYDRGSSDLADTSSPRGTLSLFLNSMNELYSAVCVKKTIERGDPEAMAIALRAASCLDVGELTGYSSYGSGAEALVCIKEVLDRVPLPPPEAIPGLEDVQSGNGGEGLARWQVPRTRITIARVQEGPRRGEYLFSPDTVKRAPQFYEEIKERPYRTDGREVSKGLHDFWLSTPHNPAIAWLVDQLPEWSESRRLGLALWQWAGLVLAVLISLGLMFTAYRIGRTRGERFRQTNLLRYCMTLIFPLVAMLVPLAFKYAAWEYLTIRSDAGHVVFFTADVIFLLALIVLLLGMSSRIAEAIIAMPQIHPQGLDAQFTRIICRAIGIVAAVIVFLEGGRHLGFPITTLLAGAGIGGLAVALAAQSLIKGLFGTVTILFDKPYQSGERIVVKGYDGVVEEIGMHATKIRLLTGHLVSIPNDQMADSEIENVGRRPHIRRTAVIEMPSDTPTAKVKRALEIVRTALKDHEGMHEDFPPRVFLRDLKESSIGILMIYWYHPPEYWEFLAFSEKVNLQIMERLEADGIEFAAPALRVHTGARDGRGPRAGVSRDNQSEEGS